MEGLHIPYRRLVEALETLNSPPVVVFNPLSVQSSVAACFQSRVSVNVCGKEFGNMSWKTSQSYKLQRVLYITSPISQGDLKKKTKLSDYY